VDDGEWGAVGGGGGDRVMMGKWLEKSNGLLRR